MLKINIFGDFVATGRLKEVLNAGNYMSVVGEDILEKLYSSDYNVINLESPITRKGKPIDKLGPNLKSPPEVLDFLEFGKFNIATLANNHIMDYGEGGLTHTFNYLKEKNIEFVGAGKDLNESSKSLILEKDGLKVGIINIAEHEFSIATDEKPGANPLMPIENYYQIKELKNEVNKVILIIHGGHEHYEYPSPRMRDTYRFFIDSGADLVVGHHPHCYSGYESHNGGLIFYSLGNFVFDKKGVANEKWNYGYGLSLNISKEDIHFSLIPYNQFSTNPIVYQLKDEELKAFKEKLEDLNAVINDRERLVVEYKKFCERRIKNLTSLFEPYENKYLRALRVRNILPSYISRRKYLRLYNYLMCQSHRDLVEYKLKIEINN